MDKTLWLIIGLLLIAFAAAGGIIHPPGDDRDG
jgi:hypothetical protein